MPSWLNTAAAMIGISSGIGTPRLPSKSTAKTPRYLKLSTNAWSASTASSSPTGSEPVFESRSRFRQVSYAVTDQQHPATSTRLKHAAESSLKHLTSRSTVLGGEVKPEPGGPSPDERKLQNNFRTGAVEAAEREWYRPARRPTDRIIRRPDPAGRISSAFQAPMSAEQASMSSRPISSP